MKFRDSAYEIGQRVIGDTLIVRFSDGTQKYYNAVELGCKWFKMSNDSFYSIYGFNFNPHKWGLYEKCRDIVYGRFA